MVKAIKFIVAIEIFFLATVLIEALFNIAKDSSIGIILEIFSDCIGITIAYFISFEATIFIAIFLFCRMFYIILEGGGTLNILFFCCYKMLPLILLCVLKTVFKFPK